MALLDLVIRNGRILDGAGNPWFNGDIGIKDGKIVKVGKIAERGEREIDAKGLFVSPGFVDIHTHADLTILAVRNAESYITQGITTAVASNCGLAMAPINPERLELLKSYVSPFLVRDFDYGWDWRSFGEFYEKVEKGGIAINLVPLAGHGTIRIFVKGFDPSPPSPDELEQMKELLRRCIDEGAFGLSTGLIYPPGSYSETGEIIELAKVLAEKGGVYLSHIRNESKRLIEAVDEAIEIGEKAEVPVQISHHKASGKPNWGKVNATLRLMERARLRGVEVNCDVYPYPAGSTTITALLPPWALQGGIQKMLERLKDKDVRAKIVKDIEEDKFEGENFLKAAGWSGVLISQCVNKDYEGRTLEEILRDRGRLDDPYDGLFDWMLEIKGDAAMVIFLMDEEDVKTVISHPLSMIGSDSWVTAPSVGGKPHPRAYGTFPRVLGKYVKEERALSLEEAIKKMTSLPASKMRIPFRGLVKEGFWADLVIFNFDKVKDKATFQEPHQYAEGIEYVLVNGELVLERGKVTGKRPGRVIKR